MCVVGTEVFICGEVVSVVGSNGDNLVSEVYIDVYLNGNVYLFHSLPITTLCTLSVVLLK